MSVRPSQWSSERLYVHNFCIGESKTHNRLIDFSNKYILLSKWNIMVEQLKWVKQQNNDGEVPQNRRKKTVLGKPTHMYINARSQ